MLLEYSNVLFSYSKLYGEQQNYSTDEKSFLFYLNLNNLNLNLNERIEINKIKQKKYKMFDKSNDLLIQLGNIFIFKERMKNKSFCLKENEQLHFIQNKF